MGGWWEKGGERALLLYDFRGDGPVVGGGGGGGGIDDLEVEPEFGGGASCHGHGQCSLRFATVDGDGDGDGERENKIPKSSSLIRGPTADLRALPRIVPAPRAGVVRLRQILQTGGALEDVEFFARGGTAVLDGGDESLRVDVLVGGVRRGDDGDGVRDAELGREDERFHVVDVVGAVGADDVDDGLAGVGWVALDDVRFRGHGGGGGRRGCRV